MNTLDPVGSTAGRRDHQAPDDGREQFRLGLLALAREEAEPARRHLEQAAALLPESAEVHAYLGCALLSAGAPAEAIGATETALQLAPDGFGPNLKGGELALRLGDPDLAERRFLAALRAAVPSSPDAAAARTLLSEARRRRAHSIRREAFLPSVRSRVGLHLPRWRAAGRDATGSRLEAAHGTGEAGGTIA